MTAVEGFPPVYDENSVLLILGSFPSVKSRAEGFYYGNPQNRFWKTLCGYFGERIPEGIAAKKEFLFRRRIALWDAVISCEIDGSKDASIRNARVAELPALLKKSGIEAVFCNGSKSYSVVEEHFPELLSIATKLPSTSPANPRFSAAVWYAALDGILKGTEK